MRFSLISVALAMVAGAFAAPTLETRQSPPTTSPARGLLCSLPIIKHTFICIPRQPNDVLINTPVGTAHGFQATANVARFAVRYAGALRWQPSIIVPVWTIPENNVTAFPKLCPQPDVDPSTYDEDCLFFVMYVPTASSATRRPITVWLHGGSNVVGGASGSGLDGSQLAEATNSIVVVAQYRLGVLGFLPPPAQGNNRNLAVRDVMNALTFLRTIAASFNGDKDKITIIGHSSGSNLVRALLAVPTAQSLFQKAIMQSDPVNYGFLSPTLQDNMRTWYYNQVSSSCSNFNTCSLSTLITVQYNLMANIMTIEPQAGTGQPLRPVKDNNLVTTSLTGSSWPSSLPKPLIMTTVKDEAGYAIYGHIPQLPSEYFPMIVTDSLGATRAEVIVESERYPYTPELSGRDDGDDTRYALQFLGTDQLWRCASWTFAREYASRGGNIWVGEFVEGVTYPINANTPYCTSGTAVCHQDEIYPVFGTSPSPTSSQSALTTMIQSRYRSFIQDSTPNPSGLATWTAATSTDVHTLRLGGGGGDAPIGQCDTSFWGSTVQYDYQAYGL